jgi:hypothetical protein
MSFDGAESLNARLFPAKGVPGARIRQGASYALFRRRSAEVSQSWWAMMQVHELSH